jgi:hypothetical protein
MADQPSDNALRAARLIDAELWDVKGYGRTPSIHDIAMILDRIYDKEMKRREVQ